MTLAEEIVKALGGEAGAPDWYEWALPIIGSVLARRETIRIGCNKCDQVFGLDVRPKACSFCGGKLTRRLIEAGDD